MAETETKDLFTIIVEVLGLEIVPAETAITLAKMHGVFETLMSIASTLTTWIIHAAEYLIAGVKFVGRELYYFIRRPKKSDTNESTETEQYQSLTEETKQLINEIPLEEKHKAGVHMFREISKDRAVQREVLEGNKDNKIFHDMVTYWSSELNKSEKKGYCCVQ